MREPVVAISIGDPAGIGPEVTAKALAHPELWDGICPLVVGDLGTMRRAAEVCGTDLAFRGIASSDEAAFDPRAPDVLDLANIGEPAIEPGALSASAGRASVDYIERAVELCQSGAADAIATGPINKAALKLAGVPFIGHTELLADLLGVGGPGADPITTMLSTTGLSVVHVTRHVPLEDVASHITRKSVMDTIRVTDAGLRQMGIAEPRIAVAALNPHGGDDGLMGRQEIEAIGPAIDAARDAGIDATGPIPADSVFFRAIRGEFDVVVAMYHDQGHIPIKTHGFEHSITVTLGLPIVRTSVDHGTAFDIAWQGVAREDSMVEAVLLAGRLARGRTGTG